MSWSGLSFDPGSFDPESFDPESWGFTWEGGQDLASKYGGGKFHQPPKHFRRREEPQLPLNIPDFIETETPKAQLGPILSPGILFPETFPDVPGLSRGAAASEEAEAEELAFILSMF